MPPPSEYPTHWEADVVLRDGGVVHLRPIQPADAPAVARLHDGQSEESIYLRFFAFLERLTPTELAWFTTVDHRDRVCLVATLGDDIVGIGRYDVVNFELTLPQQNNNPEKNNSQGQNISAEAIRTADIALNISDAHHGRGIGSVLLEHLTAAARERGIQKFTADTLPENDKMLSVFRDAGYLVQQHEDDGIVQVSFELSPTQASDRVRQSREQRAEARSMRALLYPESVVVLGVTSDPDSLGQRVLRQLRAAGFTGSISQVAPGQAWTGRAELAIVVSPAAPFEPWDLALVRDCAAAGVRGLVVLGNGYAETGPAGRELQYRLVRQARGYGMRVVGPNSFGLMNTDPGIALNATPAQNFPDAGGLGLFCQSRALGVALLSAVTRRGIGLSTFVSAGNRADVSGNDLMQYWLDDPGTAAVALYLESVGNPRKFTRVARRLARTKPVIVVKSGQTTYGVPPGHTVRDSHLPRQTFDEVLRQSGVIRCESLHQLFDVAQLVLHQPLPAGPAVAVVSNSHALGALAADACASWGLAVPNGPVTVTSTDPTEYCQVLRDAAQDPKVHSIVVGWVPPGDQIDAELAQAIAQTAAESPKPWVANFAGLHGITAQLSAAGRSIPAYPTPEDAVRALVLVTEYAAWRGQDRGPRVAPEGIDQGQARKLMARWFEQRSGPLALGPHGRWLSRIELSELLAAYGIEFSATRSPIRPQDAVDVVLRTVEDPLFGPVIEFGLGGPPSELLGDLARRSPPLHAADVPDFLRSVKAAPLLLGYRGSPPVALADLEDLLARLSVLADQLPEVAELVLNPVWCTPSGLAIAGARCRIADPLGRTDADTRRLPG